MHVLLVEDNPGDADLTRDTLEAGEAPLTISQAFDGEEALDFLLKRGQHADASSPDLVLLDINLPRLNGRQVLAEIRRHPLLRSLPVVMLSSSDSKQDVSECYALGANCFIRKAVALEEFQRLVQAIRHFWFEVVTLPS